MARMLIVAVAVIMGALSVWFLVPAVPAAEVADAPAAGLPTSKETAGQTDSPGGR